MVRSWSKSNQAGWSDNSSQAPIITPHFLDSVQNLSPACVIDYPDPAADGFEVWKELGGFSDDTLCRLSWFVLKEDARVLCSLYLPGGYYTLLYNLHTGLGVNADVCNDCRVVL